MATSCSRIFCMTHVPGGICPPRCMIRSRNRRANPGVELGCATYSKIPSHFCSQRPMLSKYWASMLSHVKLASNRERPRIAIVATGATGDLLRDKVGLDVERVTAGPHGGDVQIASRVVEGDIDAVLFMVDPLDKHPHDPDIQTLLRICNVCNIPLATNIATADVLISSPLLQEFRAAAS